MDRRRRLTAATTATAALAAVAVVWVAVAEPMRNPSDSMEPTLPAGAQVLVAKHTTVGRGDVVVFRRGGDLLLKRVAAVGGDQVGLDDGYLVVNGQRVDEPYVDRSLVAGWYFGPARVPAGMLFVLGDNRTRSEDSLDYGPVPAADVVGEVVFP